MVTITVENKDPSTGKVSKVVLTAETLTEVVEMLDEARKITFVVKGP